MGPESRILKKVLVANRGEIAVRVIRSLRELSIPAVAVFSSADAGALHVQMAEESVWIGEPHPLRSYLNIDALLQAARATGADALHPGYGFLSENWRLAERCAEEGVTFIGPPPEAIRLMGDKIASRRALARLSVPLLPGSDGPVKSAKDLEEEARRVGYPLLVKAAGGGGGRGMRLVEGPTELRQAVEAAQREAGKAFGDDAVFLERFLENPRHVEFQVLGDRHGNFVHLHERECSIQRRRQKLVEETPCTVLDDELRAEMGRAAVTAAAAAGSLSASTVEFLLDGEGRYYFLEMNTRIQVEHPITEATTGVDLVTEQIRIAEGRELAFRQEDVAPRGHAIECRVYAEDPEKDFAPSPGPIHHWKEPAGPGVRVDSSVAGPCEVPVEYDPILAKLVVWGPDRDAAIRRTLEALRSFVVLGVPTTLPFLAEVIAHPAFAKGITTTRFLEEHFRGWKRRAGLHFTEALAAAVAVACRGGNGSPAEARERDFDPWLDMGKWELGMR
ncbi:MAG: acetyl-CoA carboxylase biotin carboxylase subunit [Planctomycetota bacterium]|jgi:acetyl-CoA carboxylase biotin carboxylase subunit